MGLNKNRYHRHIVLMFGVVLAQVCVAIALEASTLTQALEDYKKNQDSMGTPQVADSFIELFASAIKSAKEEDRGDASKACKIYVGLCNSRSEFVKSLSMCGTWIKNAPDNLAGYEAALEYANLQSLLSWHQELRISAVDIINICEQAIALHDSIDADSLKNGVVAYRFADLLHTYSRHLTIAKNYDKANAISKRALAVVSDPSQVTRNDKTLAGYATTSLNAALAAKDYTYWLAGLVPDAFNGTNTPVVASNSIEQASTTLAENEDLLRWLTSNSTQLQPALLMKILSLAAEKMATKGDFDQAIKICNTSLKIYEQAVRANTVNATILRPFQLQCLSTLNSALLQSNRPEEAKFIGNVLYELQKSDPKDKQK